MTRGVEHTRPEPAFIMPTTNSVEDEKHSGDFLLAAVSAVSISIVWFALTWNYGFDLADEGYLWFGSQLTALGQVPMRDFMAYDIGRYYWTAAFMRALNSDGIFPVRLAAIVFQAVGTAIGTGICLNASPLRGTGRWAYALAASSILTIAITPYYKSYDHAASVFIVAGLLLMLSRPTRSGWFLAGVIVGLTSLIGRNHFLYGSVSAFGIVIASLVFGRPRKLVIDRSFFLALGALAGFTPMLSVMAFVDGYGLAFIQSIVFIFKLGATNIPLPVPWPWNAKTSSALLVGLGFLALLAYPLVAAAILWHRRVDSASGWYPLVLAATMSASITYMHYAFARADVIHLSLAILPLLVGAVAATSRLFPSWQSSGTLLLLTLITFTTFHKDTVAVRARTNPERFMQVEVDKHKIWTWGVTGEAILGMNREVEGRRDEKRSFLALPNLVSYHAMRRMPMGVWEIYSLVPRDAAFEDAELRLLQRRPPELVFLSDHALDGNPSLRFSATHPRIYHWIVSNYRKGCRIGSGEIFVYVSSGETKACLNPV